MSLSMTFGVSEVAATLGLTLFVIGYGVGPLFLAPLSEIPVIGRSPPYVVTLLLFAYFKPSQQLSKTSVDYWFYDSLLDLLAARFWQRAVPVWVTSSLSRRAHMPLVSGECPLYKVPSLVLCLADLPFREKIAMGFLDSTLVRRRFPSVFHFLLPGDIHQ